MTSAVFVTSADQAKHLHTFEPLMVEAERRGIDATLTETPETGADFGFYCDDNPTPGPQTVTVVMLNGLDQDHVVRPDYGRFFGANNWSKFDLGLLPGPRWRDGYASQTHRPRFGAAMVGWPKSDPLFPVANQRTRVVLAPQVGSARKTDETVAAVEKLRAEFDIGLTVKHWETHHEQSRYPWLLTDDLLAELDEAEASVDEWVQVADRRSNFMDCLDDCAVLVTEQSSVLYEAMLVDAPSISVADWPHACTISGGCPPRSDATYRIRSEELTDTLKTALSDGAAVKAREGRDHNFVNLGTAASVAWDAVQDVYKAGG